MHAKRHLPTSSDWLKNSKVNEGIKIYCSYLCDCKGFGHSWQVYPQATLIDPLTQQHILGLCSIDGKVISNLVKNHLMSNHALYSRTLQIIGGHLYPNWVYLHQFLTLSKCGTPTVPLMLKTIFEGNIIVSKLQTGRMPPTVRHPLVFPWQSVPGAYLNFKVWQPLNTHTLPP